MNEQPNQTSTLLHDLAVHSSGHCMDGSSSSSGDLRDLAVRYLAEMRMAIARCEEMAEKLEHALLSNPQPLSGASSPELESVLNQLHKKQSTRPDEVESARKRPRKSEEFQTKNFTGVTPGKETPYVLNGGEFAGAEAERLVSDAVWGSAHPDFGNEGYKKARWTEAELDYLQAWMDAHWSKECMRSKMDDRCIRCLRYIMMDSAAVPIFHQRHVLNTSRLRSGFDALNTRTTLMEAAGRK